MPADVVSTRFELHERVGAGAMGVVFRGKDLRTGLPVAIKQMRYPPRGVALERFAQEAKLLARLTHPGIVGYVAHEAEAEGELPWIAMEWLDGEDLAARLARDPLAPLAAAAIVRDVADALVHLHAAGVIHRDLKPQNIFLVTDGGRACAKLIDLGVAKDRSTDAQTLTSTGNLVGTPLYMSPEQARGSAADERSDVWSLGAMLYRAIAGDSPFAAETWLAVLGKILMGDIPRLANVAPHTPPWLAAVVERALERDPDLRYPSALLLREGLTLGLGLGASASSATLDSPPPPRSPSSAHAEAHREQRLSFVVFVDATRERSADAATLLETHGARVERIRGGFLLARFGEGRVEAEQPSRGAAVALAVRGIDPDAKVAIAIAREGAAHARDGSVIERGAALLGRARQGEVVTDPDTLVLIADRVAARVLDDRVLLDAYRGLATRHPASALDPLFGRDAELGRIEGVCREAWEDSDVRAVLVTGMPGMGKSRLLSAIAEKLTAWSPPPRVVICSADAMTADTPYATLVDGLRREMGLFAPRSPDVERQMVRDWAQRTLDPLDVGAATDHVPAFCKLIGIDAPVVEQTMASGDDEEPRISQMWKLALENPERMHAGLGRAWEAWIRAVGKKSLLVLAIDDLQWADHASLELVARLGAGDVPAVVLAFAREDTPLRFASLLADLEVEPIALRPLSTRAGSRLVTSIAGDSVSPKRLANLVARAAGNPLFLRELARAERAKGGDDIPLSVQFLVQARIDSLPSSAREVARVAAAFGDATWVEGLTYVLGRSCAKDASTLVAAEILGRRPTSSIEGLSELFFQHTVVREVTYAMAVDDDQRVYHERIGAWLERHASPRRPQALGFHAERAGNLARAAHLYADAAREAAHLQQPRQEATLLLRALTCGMDASEPAEVITEWLRDLDLPMRIVRELEGVQELVERVLVYVDRAPSGGPSVHVACRVVATSIFGTLHVRSHADAMFAELAVLLCDDLDALVDLYLERAWRAQQQGDFVLGASILERVSELPEQPRHAFRTACLGALAAACTGETAKAFALIARAREFEVTSAEAAVELHDAEFTAHYFAGQYERAARVSIAAYETAMGANLLLKAATEMHNTGDALMCAGNTTQARACFVRSHEVSKKHGFLRLEHANTAQVAYLDALAGDVPALAVLTYEVRLARARQNWFDAVEFTWLLAQAQLTNGQEKAARSSFEDAAKLAERQGNHPRGKAARAKLAEMDAHAAKCAATDPRGPGHSDKHSDKQAGTSDGHAG